MSISYNLDVRCCEILEYLLYKDEYVSIQQLADEKGISRRSVYYDMHKINDWIEDQGLSEIEIIRGKGILIGRKEKEEIRSRLGSIPPQAAYAFTPVERMKIILCSVLLRNRKLRIEDFMDLCQVSRNTTINDLKEAGKLISPYKLQLVYENGKGYHIVGDYVKKRTIFFLYFNSIADFYKVEACTDNMKFSEKEKSEIKNTLEYQLVHKRFHELEESEQLYLMLHLLGSRMQSTPVNLVNDETGKEAKSLAVILVQAFSRIAGIEFVKEEELIHAVAVHLSTSLYRYRYGILLGNPILTDQDRIAILKRCMKFEYQNKVDVAEIMKLAAKYMTNQRLQKFKADLTEYFSSRSMKRILGRDKQKYGICQMMTVEHAGIAHGKHTWREAIRLAGKSLLDNHVITMPYLDSIIQKTIKYGPYMFITENVFLAHSEIEDGANQLGISLTVFKDPVEFITLDGLTRKAKIILTLAAEDQATHIRILTSIKQEFPQPLQVAG